MNPQEADYDERVQAWIKRTISTTSASSTSWHTQLRPCHLPEPADVTHCRGRSYSCLIRRQRRTGQTVRPLCFVVCLGGFA